MDYLAKGNNEAKFVAGNSLMIIFFVINVFFILLHCTFRWSCSCLLSVKNCIVKIIYDGVNKVRLVIEILRYQISTFSLSLHSLCNQFLFLFQEFVHAIVASIVCAVATILYLIVAVGCSNGDEDETGFSECWTYYLESVRFSFILFSY